MSNRPELPAGAVVLSETRFHRVFVVRYGHDWELLIQKRTARGWFPNFETPDVLTTDEILRLAEHVKAARLLGEKGSE